MAFAVSKFTELAIIQWHYVDISRTELQPDQ